MAAIISRRVCIKKPLLDIMAMIGLVMMLLILLFRFISRNLHLGQLGLNISVLAIGTALVLIWMQKRFKNSQQSLTKYTRVLSFMGRNSYEIYLTHMFVVISLVSGYKALGLSGEWTWGLYISVIVLSGLLGAAVTRYFSTPANNFLRAQYKKEK
jgi:peptidoglycan/LPS O-acetylase OafA/YrhL